MTASTPSAAEEQEAERLARAYSVASREEMLALYRDWAATYDEEGPGAPRYIAPRIVADELARRIAGDVEVLDIGCGTGQTGAALAALGARSIDGLDLSPEMLAVAAEKGIYRRLIEADLNAALPIPAAAYGAAACCGTFTRGHVGASALEEVFRVLRPGAPLVATIHQAVWDTGGFARAVVHLRAAGIAELVWRRWLPYYEGWPAQANLCVFERLA